MNYALVTGASRGIGRAIAIQLAKDGYSVIINYKSNHAAAEETLRLIHEVGGTAELLPFDVTDDNAINVTLDNWERQHPSEYIEVLINNAGIRMDASFLLMTSSEWQQVINVSLNAIYNVTQRVLKNMSLERYGRVVNISSIAATTNHVGPANYSAAKAALIGATKSLAQEFAVRNITVNAVAPGYIDTDMLKGANVEDIICQIPMRRLGKPEDVASLVSFLVSDKSAYISGQVIAVAGGIV